MNTKFWTDHDADDFVDRLTTHFDEHAARAGTPAQPGEPDRDGAGALTEELRTAATWAGPPAGLRDMILARARAGSAAAPAATAVTGETVSHAPAAPPAPPAPVAPPTALESAPARLVWPATTPPAPDTTAVLPGTPVAGPVRPGWRARWLAAWRVRWRRLAWAIPATALAAVLFTVGVLAVDRALQPDQPRAEVFAVAGTQLAPQARGEVRVSDTPSGFSIVVDVQGLPAAAPGSYYAAWLRGPAGIVPLGSFHMRGTGTPVRLWSGVPPDRYPDLVVTLQAEGDPLVPSQLVVMTVSLAR
jgi:hypothetical protein